MVVGVAGLCVQCRERDLGGSILPLALLVLFCLRHHQGKNDHQQVVFATIQDLFDNRVSKNIELENVVTLSDVRRVAY
jgi:hypothetical protein